MVLHVGSNGMNRPEGKVVQPVHFSGAHGAQRGSMKGIFFKKLNIYIIRYTLCV